MKKVCVLVFINYYMVTCFGQSLVIFRTVGETKLQILPYIPSKTLTARRSKVE